MRPGTMVLCAVLGVLATGTSTWGDNLPEIKSRSAAVIDAKSGAEIFGKDADEVRPIASTTKIFVALAVRKHDLALDGWTEITKTDAEYAKGGARTRLDIGQVFRNKDLLRAMLVASDNRAPTALARGAGMDPDELVAAMNAVAKKLGLKHTKLTDPTGLNGNVSTAREMAIALNAALADDVLRDVMGEESADVTSKDHYAKIHYHSTNLPLVSGKWNVVGGKTGYTSAAGYCFVTGARINDRAIVMAFLGAEGKLTRFGDFERVARWLDHGGGKVSEKRPKHAETRGRVAAP
jgi:D-alanyl-D-alanine endopeptidase (penicillin-binding protein 7)